MVKHERELNSHKINPANDMLKVVAVDAPGIGGASHLYDISGFDGKTNPSERGVGLPTGTHVNGCAILFQQGAINEVGVNGITHEALMAILIDRLEGFQSGPYANAYNEIALTNIKVAQSYLLQRTKDRMAQGVEGTLQVGTESSPIESNDTSASKKERGRTGNPILKFFTHDHLQPGPLRETSALFTLFARDLEHQVPDGAEKSAGLRKLLEAKDCFVRAAITR